MPEIGAGESLGPCCYCLRPVYFGFGGQPYLRMIGNAPAHMGCWEVANRTGASPAAPSPEPESPPEPSGIHQPAVAVDDPDVLAAVESKVDLADAP